MARVLTTGGALTVPATVKSRRLPRVVNADLQALLSYEEIEFAMMVHGGIKTFAPLELTDMIKGLPILPVGDDPVVIRDASGDGRMGLQFTRDGSGNSRRLLANYELPPSYTIMMVVNAPNNMSGVNTLVQQNDLTGDDLLLWLSQDSAGAPFDLNYRHGTALTKTGNQKVPVATRCIITAFYNAALGHGGAYVNQTVAVTGTMDDHNGTVGLSIGGSPTANFGLAATVEALIILNEPLYSAYAADAVNGYRQQLIAEAGAYFDVANTAVP